LYINLATYSAKAYNVYVCTRPRVIYKLIYNNYETFTVILANVFKMKAMPGQFLHIARIQDIDIFG